MALVQQQVVKQGFFLRKMLGTRNGSVGIRFSDFRDPMIIF